MVTHNPKQPIVTEIFTQSDLDKLTPKEQELMLYNYKGIQKAIYDNHAQHDWRIAKRKFIESPSDPYLISKHNPTSRLHIYNDEVYLDNIGHLENNELQMIIDIQTFR